MIDLKELTEGRYKVNIIDESWEFEVNKKPEDRMWYEGILCTEGAYIDVYAENPKPILRLMTTRRINAKDIASKIPGSKFDSTDSEEVQVFFDPKYLLQVCRLAGARRKKKLPDSLREAFASGRKLGLKALHEARNQTQDQTIPPL